MKKKQLQDFPQFVVFSSTFCFSVVEIVRFVWFSIVEYISLLYGDFVNVFVCSFCIILKKKKKKIIHIVSKWWFRKFWTYKQHRIARLMINKHGIIQCRYCILRTRWWWTLLGGMLIIYTILIHLNGLDCAALCYVWLRVIESLAKTAHNLTSNWTDWDRNMWEKRAIKQT